MELVARTGTLLNEPGALNVLLSSEEAPLPAEIAGLIEASDFSGKAKQTRLIYPHGALAAKRLLLIGLGKAAQLSSETLRQAAATAVRQAQELRVEALTIGMNSTLALTPLLVGQAIAEGLELGTYRYYRYRTNLTEEQRFVVEQATILVNGDRDQIEAGLALGQTIARGVVTARDLVNTPGSALSPAMLADIATALASRLNLRATVFDKAQLREQGFGGILAVGQGSANEPRLIVLEHGEAQEGQPTICLVGKGITFDSGGLSLKPADSMVSMKSDMSGSAAVLGTMQVVAELNLPLHVVGIVPSAENMPSGTAYRPDDVITTLSGKTVEVLNTDAEGRIVLADGLHYAQRYQPHAIIELSTLTGAIVVALGTHVTGMMSTNQELADQVKRAGEIAGERVWQMPLWEEYHEMIKSEIADIRNTGGVRAGGALTAAAFLATFVGDYPFVHLDIAGTAFVEKPRKPYETVGSTGVGVRLLTELLRSYTR